MKRTVFRLALVAAFVATPTALQANIISTFDAGLEGWTTDNTGLFQHQGAGGNPGGYLYLDNDEGAVAHIFASAAFLGDLSLYNGGTFSFDGNLLGMGGGFYNAADDYGLVQISGPGGTASLDLLPGGDTPSFQTWETFSAPFTATAFGVSDAQWAAILANVTGFRLTIESLFGPEIEGVDNVRLVASVPEPSTLAVLAVGLAGIAATTRRRKRKTILQAA